MTSSSRGPDHAKPFLGRGQRRRSGARPGAGGNKKEAEQIAAAIAFAALKGSRGSGPATARWPEHMPELPEVEVVRRGLANSITGRQIVQGAGTPRATGTSAPHRA